MPFMPDMYGPPEMGGELEERKRQLIRKLMAGGSRGARGAMMGPRGARGLMGALSGGFRGSMGYGAGPSIASLVSQLTDRSFNANPSPQQMNLPPLNGPPKNAGPGPRPPAGPGGLPPWVPRDIFPYGNDPYSDPINTQRLGRYGAY